MSPVRSVTYVSGPDLRYMAERVGFEPTVEFPLHSLSRRALSTAQTPLRTNSGCSSLTNAPSGHNYALRPCDAMVRTVRRRGSALHSILRRRDDPAQDCDGCFG